MFIVLTFIINRIRGTFMDTLGLNSVYHDSTVYCLKDRRRVVALEEERLTRRSIGRCSPTGNRVLSGNCRLPPEGIDLSRSPTSRSSTGVKKSSIGWDRCVNENPLLNIMCCIPCASKNLENLAGYKKPRIHCVPHHISHLVGPLFWS
jgi:predicted NodU family carbamoyl transferase